MRAVIAVIVPPQRGHVRWQTATWYSLRRCIAELGRNDVPCQQGAIVVTRGPLCGPKWCVLRTAGRALVRSEEEDGHKGEQEDSEEQDAATRSRGYHSLAFSIKEEEAG